MDGKTKKDTKKTKKTGWWAIMINPLKSISLVKKLENSMEFAIQHSNDGQMKERSLVSELLETKDSMDAMISEESLGLKVLKRKRESYVFIKKIYYTSSKGF